MAGRYLEVEEGGERRSETSDETSENKREDKG
jgi:hypothetical protein